MEDCELCPHCNEPFKWNKENLINIGYLLAFIVPLIIVLTLWAIFFSGLFLGE
jgi:hypothetical protein